MAETNLSDIFDAEVFDAYSVDRVIQKSAIINSGIAIEVPRFNEFLAGPGSTVTAPIWKSIGLDEPNAASDVAATKSASKEFTTRTELAVRHSVNQSWSAMNLAVDVAGDDPMESVLNQVAAYWDNDIQVRCFKTALGLLLDSIASHAGDMVNDISSTAADNAVVDANRFSADAFLDADATMGEYMGDLAGFLTHPVVYNRMRKLNLIDYIPEAEGQRLIPTYMGARIFLYKNAPTVSYDNSSAAEDAILRYYSVLFAPGAMGLGLGLGKSPSAIEFDQAAGRGAGQETLFDRKQWVVHPAGYSWAPTDTVGAPTYAELAAAASWTRSASDRERIKIAGLLTNA